VGSKGCKSVKYCVQDQCQGNEPRVLKVRVQSNLLSVILEIIVSVLFALLTVLTVLSVLSVNTVIC